MSKAQDILDNKAKDGKRLLRNIEITKEQRDSILEAIKNFDNPDEFPIDDARKAIAYCWSVIVRLENEIATTNDNKLLGTLYGNLVRATKTLVDQMLTHQKIQESKAKQEYITIATHSAILKALQDIFILSLRKRGFTEQQIVDLVAEMARLQKEYPVVELDMPTIRERLYGEREKEIVYIEPPKSEEEKLAELEQVLTPIPRKSKKSGKE